MKIITLFFLLLLFKTEAQTSVLNIADSLYQNGNYSKAIIQYKTYKNQSEVYDKIAKANIAIGNYDEALKYYNLSVEANPENTLLKYNYGKLLFKTKKFDEASKVFKNLIDIDDENPNYHYELGLILERQKDSLAQKRFLKAFKLDNAHQKAIFKIAKRHLIKRKHDSVNYYLDIGFKTYENNVELISLKAQNYYWQQEYRNAAKWFEKLIALGEVSEFIFEKLSQCYAKHYDFENAIKNRKLALKFNPKSATTIYAIGSYYGKLQDYKSAEEYLAKALKIMDTALNAEYREFATILNRQNKHKEAIVALKKAITEDPKDEFSHFFMATTLSKYYRDYDAKIKAFEDFKKKFPESRIGYVADNLIKKLKEEQFKIQEAKTD